METITFVAAMATIFFMVAGILFREFVPINAMLAWLFLTSLGITLILSLVGLLFVS